MDMNLKDEGQSARYLLGEMTEAEQARFEERFFHDVELSELLSDLENDLIDAYVRGELSQRETERFEQHFLISVRRREKLDLAQALLQAKYAGTSARLVDSRTSVPWWKAMVAQLRAPGPALSYSFGAAALCLLVAGLLLFSEVRNLRNETARLAAERDRQSAQNDQLREQANERQRQSDELATQKDQLERQLEELQTQAGTPSPRPALSFLSFILSPVSRGRDGPKKLIIPPGTGAVRLQLNLSAGDDYPSYQVSLRKANGEQVRSWKGLRAAPAKSARAVFVEIQADSLSVGEFEVTLSGVAKGQIEPLGYYYFSLPRN
jgi:hypothetical protein